MIEANQLGVLCAKFFGKINKSFSIETNWRKLTADRKLQGNRRVVRQLSSIDLLRVISTLWIVVIHSYNFALGWMKFDDNEEKRDVYKSLFSQFIANGTFAVDNFFFMSGFLAFLRNRQSEKRQSISQERNNPRVAGDFHNRWRRLSALIVQRYIRLVPLMMCMIFISVLMLPQLNGTSDQQRWLVATQMFDQWCRLNWPVNILLAHNLFQTQQMCFSHSWYLAADFQLFVLLQVVIFMFNLNLSEHGASGWITTISIFFALVGQLVCASLTYIYNLPAVPLVPVKDQRSVEVYYRIIYIKPFQWLSSYFIGIISAKYILDRRVESPTRHQTNSIKFLQTILTALLFSVVISNMFYFREETPMSRHYATVYSLFARPIWTICIAGLIVLFSREASCKTARDRSQKATKMNLLSTLSRLSFSVYLLHPVVMSTFYGNRTETFQFSNYLLLYFTIGNIVLTYSGAILIYLFVERPIQNLFQTERGFFSKGINTASCALDRNALKAQAGTSSQSKRYELQSLERKTDAVDRPTCETML